MVVVYVRSRWVWVSLGLLCWLSSRPGKDDVAPIVCSSRTEVQPSDKAWGYIGMQWLKNLGKEPFRINTPITVEGTEGSKNVWYKEFYHFLVQFGRGTTWMKKMQDSGAHSCRLVRHRWMHQLHSWGVFCLPHLSRYCCWKRRLAAARVYYSHFFQDDRALQFLGAALLTRHVV